jgi:glyoxylase I family protein
MDASLRFYRDGIGLTVLRESEVEGDWPALFDAPSDRVRLVFLGDPSVPDVSAGVLELNEFIGGDVPARTPFGPPTAGLLMISFFVDVEATLGRLSDLALGGEPRKVEQPTPGGPITIVTVRDPDGTLVLLTPGSITQAH